MRPQTRLRCVDEPRRSMAQTQDRALSACRAWQELRLMPSRPRHLLASRRRAHSGDSRCACKIAHRQTSNAGLQDASQSPLGVIGSTRTMQKTLELCPICIEWRLATGGCPCIHDLNQAPHMTRASTESPRSRAITAPSTQVQPSSGVDKASMRGASATECSLATQ